MSTVTLGTADDYVAFCEGVRALVGLDLSQYKRAQMERRLRTFAQRIGILALPEYLAVLRRDADELERFLDRVTINVSQLWRNPEQWAMLGRTVVPELSKAGRIRIWSAGCSYGAECYTIAAICLEHDSKLRIEVTGSDIDPRMLERARAGVFSAEDARTVPPASLKRWFEPAGHAWHVKPELRQLVTYEQRDLLSSHIPAQKYDLVLCRNVVIYFTEDVRDRLHQRLAFSLVDGGYLVVGSTERLAEPGRLGLDLTHPFTYRKA